MTIESQLMRLGLFDARVPRYTSYPTAPHFAGGVGPETFVQWIEAIPAHSEISLYMHVPFCRRLCWFCACRTQGTSSDTPVLAYAQVLKAEIALLQRQTRTRRGQQPLRSSDLELAAEAAAGARRRELCEPCRSRHAHTGV